MKDGSPHPIRKSDEATAEGLRLAREAGDAYRRSVEHFLLYLANDGSTKQVGDYRIGVALESAEPLWQPCGDHLELHEPPAAANQHLEVVVTDAADGRFVPCLDINVTVLCGEDEIGTWDLPFLWHPTMYHYGRNVTIPESATYTLRVSIAAPTFARHDKVNGNRFAEPVVAVFEGLELKQGRESR